MKTIERFGAWIVSDWFLWLAFLVALVTAVYSIKTAIHTVPISDEHFECTATDAVGIKARCTQYTMKGLSKSLANREE